MTTNEKHPHIERPTDEALSALLKDRPPGVLAAYLAAHRLVLETLADIAYSTDEVDGVTGYGARQYGYGGWGMAALGAHAKWASLMFMQGADLDDPEGLLEGTGKKMRHVKLRTADQVEERRLALRGLVQSAARVNDG
jgi:hypothetical protein